MIRAGQLDRRITIQTPTLSQNAEGAAVPSYSTFAEVWARKEDLRGEELFAAQKEDAEVTTRWTIRHLTGLRNDMRISYGGNYYDIISILEIGRREGFLITSKAKVL